MICVYPLFSGCIASQPPVWIIWNTGYVCCRDAKPRKHNG